MQSESLEVKAGCRRGGAHLGYRCGTGAGSAVFIREEDHAIGTGCLFPVSRQCISRRAGTEVTGRASGDGIFPSVSVTDRIEVKETQGKILQICAAARERVKIDKTKIVERWYPGRRDRCC